ncbi:benzoyl-CoA reductase, bzd-type, subunit Q [Thermodesulfobacteriota bacterium]
MVTEYWRWTESRWTAPDKDWKKAKVITAGVDIGSVSTQAVITVDSELYVYSNIRTGSNSPDSALTALGKALDGTGMRLEDIHYTVATGYGRINIPFADRTITEISCHAKGANFIYGPTVRTILDMGGQDCKAIRCNERGDVLNFLMNDKCAAGTGRGMEVFAELMAIPIDEVGQLSLQVDEEPPPVSSVCVIFAKTEVLELRRQGWSDNKVLAAYCSAMAHIVVNLLKRAGVEEDFAITGGIAKNIGIVKRIERELNITALSPTLDTQIAGALGAALIAKTLFDKSQSLSESSVSGQ